MRQPADPADSLKPISVEPGWSRAYIGLTIALSRKRFALALLYFTR
jgi:hypothetical protein